MKIETEKLINEDLKRMLSKSGFIKEVSRHTSTGWGDTFVLVVNGMNFIYSKQDARDHDHDIITNKHKYNENIQTLHNRDLLRDLQSGELHEFASKSTQGINSNNPKYLLGIDKMYYSYDSESERDEDYNALRQTVKNDVPASVSDVPKKETDIPKSFDINSELFKKDKVVALIKELIKETNIIFSDLFPEIYEGFLRMESHIREYPEPFISNGILQEIDKLGVK